jgi:thiamine biosynthesis lipoprotein
LPIRTQVAMNTIVTLHIVSPEAPAEAFESAFGWFHEIEARCSRFDSTSELMRLCARPGEAIEVSPLLFEAVRFARIVAEASGGAFDPTQGARMAELGFNRHHVTGESVPAHATPAATWRDIEIDTERRTILLRRTLTLDLASVVKGLAIDLAAREFAPFLDFAIDAGGDLYVSGANEKAEPWSVGVRHPRRDGELIASLRVSDCAVCTTGDYERHLATGHHILDPATGASAQAAASATVVAPSAMVADALATAAFVMGPEIAIPFLERMGVDGLIITPELKRFETRGLRDAA